MLFLMNKKTLTKIINKIISPIAGKKRFQKFFESLHQFYLLCMNMGGGSDPKNSGEKQAMKYISGRLKAIDELTIFDIGANVGNFSAMVKEVFGDKSRVYSFEPSQKTFQKLSLNLQGKTGIELYNFGFGDQNAKATLFSDSDESVFASVYKRKMDHYDRSLDRSEEIEIKTLDAFCQEHGIGRIHYLKLDVEGHEMKVLSGASRMLNSGAIDFIQFEFGGCNIDSRTYFKDFYYLLKDNHKIYRIVKDGLYPIDKYKEMYEAFATTNYLAEKR